MAETSECASIDAGLYKPADAFFREQSGTALTYDDVTLATLYSDVLPRETNLEISLAKGLQLSIPIISADMDTVTESRMAIAMALNGGLGLIHYNMPERQQLSEVSRVKNHIHGLIQEPIKISPSQSIGDVLALVEQRGFAFRTFPVVDDGNKLLGLLTGHVVRPRYATRKVSEAMTPRHLLQTVNEKELGSDPIARADRFFNEHIGIHKLLVVDDADCLRGLFTISDIERITQEKSAQSKPARDDNFRLLCGAAVSATRQSTGELDKNAIVNHVGALVERGLDVVAVSTAHGFSKGVGRHGETPSGASSPEAADHRRQRHQRRGRGISRGLRGEHHQGRPGPRLDLHHAHRRRRGHPAAHGALRRLPGGGEKRGAHPRGWRHYKIGRHREGAHAFTRGDLRQPACRLHGSAGRHHRDRRQTLQTIPRHGQPCGDEGGSLGGVRYGHSKDSTRKIGAAEGIEALKEVSASLDTVLSQLIGGVQSGLGYLGAKNLDDMRKKARFIRVTPAGQRESAPHDIVEVKCVKLGYYRCPTYNLQLKAFVKDAKIDSILSGLM